MKKSNIIIPITISVTYLLLTIFYYHIDKHLTGILYLILALLIPISFITLIVYAIIGLVSIVRNYKIITLKICLPTLICTLTLLYIFFSPIRLNSEDFLESKIEFRACYEGTQNQATIKFREDKTFEIRWTSILLSESWTGRWSKNGDSIFFNYNDKELDRIGDSVVIDNGYLRPIGVAFDTVNFPRPMFYLGYCKGEN